MISAAMVGLDATNEQPRVCSTFTTRDPVGPAELREAMRQVVRLVRAEYPDVRYCSFVEFTTGEGPRSGGARRPHLHGLWKGIGQEAAPLVGGAAVHVLERIAGSWRHDVDEIRTPAGATMYVARHHLKESQAPPLSWGSLRRVRPSKGYWSEPSMDLRRRATAQVRRRRIARAIDAVADRNPTVPDEVIEQLLSERLAEPVPELVKVREHRGRLVEVLGHA